MMVLVCADEDIFEFVLNSMFGNLKYVEELNLLDDFEARVEWYL